MGNCLQSGSRNLSMEMGEQLIKVMKVDGKILEYKAPLLVKQLLVDYAGHVVVNSAAVCRHLYPEYELPPGELYYLLPDPQCSNDNVDASSKCNDNIGFENGEHQDPLRTGSKPVQVSEHDRKRVVRLKVVVTKQQLAELLSKASHPAKGTSLEDLVIELQSKSVTASHNIDSAAIRTNNCGWRPALESIPEGYDAVF